MGRLFSVFGPTMMLFWVMILIYNFSGLFGRLLGVVSRPTEVAAIMDADVRGLQPEHRNVANLTTWVRSK